MKLTIQECVSFGWRTFKSRAWFFVGAFLLIFLASWAANEPRDAFRHMGGPESFVAGFLYFFLWVALSFVISMGEYHFALRAHDDAANVTLQDLIWTRPFWRYAGTCLLMVIILIPAYLLLIVPGVILSLAFSFANLIALEQETTPIGALKESMRITKGHRGKLFLLILTLIGINLLGLLALVVGLLVSVPVSVFAFVHAYRTLEGQALQPAMPLPDAPQEPVAA